MPRPKDAMKMPWRSSVNQAISWALRVACSDSGFWPMGAGIIWRRRSGLEQSLRICQDLADDLGVDMACNRLGIVAWNQGEY